MGSQFGICLFTRKISNMKTFLALLLTGFALTYAFEETIDEFNDEFNIIVEEDLKAAEAQRLKEIETKINEHNQKFANGDATFGEKLYAFSDLSEDEIENKMMGLTGWDPKRGDAPPERAMGLIMPPESERINPPEKELESLYAMDRGYSPRAYFSVNEGLVTIAKNQGNCGSCAAFAATGLHETCMAKAGAATAKLDLSEQYLIDCGYNAGSMNACWGAWPHAYTDWFANNGGVSPHEGHLPYLDKNPELNCRKAGRARKWKSGAKVVSSIKDFRCNEAKLKKMVFEQGAVLVSVYASDDQFSDYDGKGVVDQCTRGEKANHAVLVVGYGSENGKKYWLIKNSWGKNWGLNGHIKLARGKNACTVEDLCISAKCVANGQQETAPTTPKPPPIPVNFWCDISSMLKPGQKLNGVYNLRRKGPHGGLIESKVRCKGTKCTPSTPGPSNACMYICGRVNC